MKHIYTVLILLFLSLMLKAQNNATIKGIVLDSDNNPIDNITIYIDGNEVSNMSIEEGNFIITGLSEGQHEITIIDADKKKYAKTITLKTDETKEIKITTRGNEGNYIADNYIDKIIIIGKPKQPEKLETITRLPLAPREMSQTISVIPEQIIKDQGAETLTEAARNVPGVILFGTYGGTKESMSIRGYRGVPILKNGVQIDSDFRTASLLSDMQGVESVQVLKGSAAVTQGIGNGLGSPGGVINVVTKTPHFVDKGEVTLKSGSWGIFRPAFDFQTVLDKNKTTAFRLNGVYQRADSYKSRRNNNRVYINPSFEWRPDSKTRITLEMDYLNDNTTPDRGTINLGPDTENHLYNLPHKKFFGWSTDNVHTRTTTYTARFSRDLNDNLSIRALYSGANNKVENEGVGSLNKAYKGNYYQRERSLTKSESEDKSNVIQLDLIGKNIYTGIVKHTFQAGFDYKTSDKTNINYKSKFVDVIDVLNDIPNNLPQGISSSLLDETGRTITKSEVYGLMAQEVMSITDYVKATLALRYSQNAKKTNANSTNEAWDPFFGLMITPVKNISVFGNYATTTDLRSSSNLTIDGGTVGASVSKQWEFGLKSDWLQNKLGFNVTYFHIQNNDLSYLIYENGQSTDLYDFAGDIVRQGIEIELTGKILDNLKVIAGYSYLDAKYRNSPTFQNDSRPMNVPRNTANGWVQYAFNTGVLKNLSLSAGIYYVGNRPVNDYSLSPDMHGSMIGQKPFNMPGYTTVNAQIAYSYKNIGMQIFFNNIFDEMGYSSYYRGGYINQIDPRNFAAQISYKF